MQNWPPKIPSPATKHQLLFRWLPRIAGEILTTYLRLEVVGHENLPTGGPVLFTPNHSGFSGLDALVLSHVLQQRTHRTAFVLSHKFWFKTKFLATNLKKLGFIEATKSNGIRLLNHNQQVVIFPEGEEGNFKASKKSYQLQEFKRGSVRMALRTGATIVPTVIMGAEESHINLMEIRSTRFLNGLLLPLPLNLIPFPAKWKIIFLDPIRLPFSKEQGNDRELTVELTSILRERIQAKINDELKIRGWRFL